MKITGRSQLFKKGNFSKLLIMMLSMVLLISGCSSASKEKSIQLSLPKPTGSYNVGITEWHLTDNKRTDPWVKGKNRELMVSIWYPAENDYKGKLAPYMSKQVAKLNGEQFASTFQLNPTQINWDSIKTHAWANAPVESQLGPRPVILYSPGGSLPRTMSTFLVEELVSQGYVVVTVDHTYETAVEFPKNRLEKVSLPKFSKDRLKKSLQVREMDIRFVLDQLTLLKEGQHPNVEQKLPHELHQLLDLTKIGIFGHSAGGYTAASTMYVDQRIGAGINMDGSLGYEEKSGQVSFPAVPKEINRPFLLLDADNNTHLKAPSMKLIWAKLDGWKLDLNLPKGEHFTFTDYMAFLPELEKQLDLSDQMIKQSIGTTQDSDRVIKSLRSYITAFFDEHLQQIPQKILDGPSSDHPDVKFVR